MAHHKLVLLALLVVLYVTVAYARDEECKSIPRWGLCKPQRGSGREGESGDEKKHRKCERCAEGTSCKQEVGGPLWKCLPFPRPSPSPSPLPAPAPTPSPAHAPQHAPAPPSPSCPAICKVEKNGKKVTGICSKAKTDNLKWTDTHCPEGYIDSGKKCTTLVRWNNDCGVCCIPKSYPSPSPPPTHTSPSLSPATTKPSPSPPTPTPVAVGPTTGLANPTTGCTDISAACAAWGPSFCNSPGVDTTCPCMCGGRTPALAPAPAPALAPAPAPALAPAPAPAVAPAPAPGGGSVTNYISSQQWAQLFPNRNNPACQGAATNFYNYDAFVQAARSFPGFGTSSSDPVVNKRELAAFLGQISHETTGGAPGGPYTWGLCFITEAGPASDYCQPNIRYPCAPGKKYFGRGPFQLSWNYNYGPAGQAIRFDGLTNPEIVATDPVIAFKTAIWFWMTPQAPKPSCHDVMTGRYTQFSPDKPAGYGLLTNIVNGGIECSKGRRTPQEQDRIGYYLHHCSILGVAPDVNLSCADQLGF